MKLRFDALPIGVMALASFLASGNAPQPQDPGGANSLVADVRQGTTFRFQIRPTGPLFVFRLTGDKEKNLITHIDVYLEGSPRPLQALESEMDEPPYRDAEYFEAVDLNFDGYEDVQLLIMRGVTGNRVYSHWLFDPKTDRFVRHQELDKAVNPIPDPATKQLKTFWNGGGTYTARVYHWEEGKLVLEREEKKDWVHEKEYFLKVIKERQNGKLVVVREEIIRRDP